MKRIAAAVGGLVWGVMLAWLSLYMASHVEWPTPKAQAIGCRELEHCPHAWWIYPLLFLALLWPSLSLATVNALAWKRWTLKRWATVVAAINVAGVLFYFAGYVVPVI